MTREASARPQDHSARRAGHWGWGHEWRFGYGFTCDVWVSFRSDPTGDTTQTPDAL
ncbi:MAG: hypothetical protein ABSB24_15710 [Gaiellaceae bacterium]